MLLVPPRHGKSELASRRFPAQFLGRFPDRQIISVSATAEFAADFGRDVRNIIASEEYRGLYPQTSLAADSSAKGKWHTSQGGVYVSAGVDSAIMGRGAHVVLIDDPFPSMLEARSETNRDKVKRYYSSTLYNRLMPGGAIILINHRMNEDDLSGFLLEQQANGGDKWKVVEMPAINDQGEALWPEDFPVDALERIRRVMMPVDWAALYMQRPAPEEGAFFKSEWFKYYDAIPEHVHYYGGSDYAVTDGRGDYTVHMTVAVDGSGNVYIADLWRKQALSDVWIETFLDLVATYQPLGWAEEQGQILKSIGPFLDRRANERGIYCSRTQFTSANDKPTRARALQARMASGKVFFPKYAPWLADLQAELLTFPMGKNDDQVDALSIVFRLLAEMTGAALPEKKRDRDGWDKAFNDDDDEDSWKTV